MTLLKSIHKILCYIPISIQIFFLILAIRSNIFWEYIPYYGRVDKRNIGFQSFFDLLMILYDCLIVSLILWSLSSINMHMKDSFSLNKTSNKIGILGFIISIVVLFLDPFGIFKYLID